MLQYLHALLRKSQIIILYYLLDIFEKLISLLHFMITITI